MEVIHIKLIRIFRVPLEILSGLLPRSLYDILVFEMGSFVGRAITKKLVLNKDLENYINLGSGFKTFDDYINIDFFSFSNKADYEADFRYPLKINDDCVDGIFTEHVLEHLTYDQVERLLKECYRILKPGGIIRIIVPDVSIFIEKYCLNDTDWFSQWEKHVFIESEDVTRRNRRMISKMTAVSFVTQEYGHVSCWDFETLEIFLATANFKMTEKTAFEQGSNKKLLKDNDSRASISLYVEGSK